MRRFCGFYFFFFLHFVIPFFQLHLVAVDIPATSSRIPRTKPQFRCRTVPNALPHCKTPQFPASPSRFRNLYLYHDASVRSLSARLRWTLATVVLLFRINIRRFPRQRIYADIQISCVAWLRCNI